MDFDERLKAVLGCVQLGDILRINGRRWHIEDNFIPSVTRSESPRGLLAAIFLMKRTRCLEADIKSRSLMGHSSILSIDKTFKDGAVGACVSNSSAPYISGNVGKGLISGVNVCWRLE